jgi:hypothetical protein
MMAIDAENFHGRWGLSIYQRRHGRPDLVAQCDRQINAAEGSFPAPVWTRRFVTAR